MKTTERKFDRGTQVPQARRQRGVVLVAALAVLLMLALLSVGMFRGFGLEERITGNSREKAHAFYAAQTALQYVEQQLLQPGNTAQIDCSSVLTLNPGTIVVCDYATRPTQTNLASTTWSSIPAVAAYTLPSALSYTTTLPTSGTTSPTYLYANPQYQVSFLGTDPSTPNGSLYTVTAMGYGANINANAIVQSVYSVAPASRQVNK